MNLKHLTDQQLNLDIKNLVQNERALLTQILYHLKEMDSRKLYSSYGYSSLFDYACKELKYSSDQAYRRIQAMRLLKTLPEVESRAVVQKIDSGELSLSNITQAQKYFKDTKALNQKDLSKTEKINVLKKLINKSTREGQKELLSLNPVIPLPEDTKKQITPTDTYVGFSMSNNLEKKLDEIRNLLGPKTFNSKGIILSMAELIDIMAELSKEKLMEKKFGKRFLQASENLNVQNKLKIGTTKNENLVYEQNLNVQVLKPNNQFDLQKKPLNNRYISKKLRYTLWQRDQHKCTKCESQFNLNIDHKIPLALNGPTHVENLRILCGNCNQRQRLLAKL